jgi:hypothetical protein
MTQHVPAVPSWDCLSCRHPWPCDPRRAELIRAYVGRTAALIVFQTANMIVAMTDLPNITCGYMYARFLGWIGATPGRGGGSLGT